LHAVKLININPL